MRQRQRSKKEKTYIVPIALARLQGRALEPKSTFPIPTLACILGQRKLALVSVPRAKQMYRLDLGGRGEVEGELNSRHNGLIGCAKRQKNRY